MAEKVRLTKRLCEELLKAAPEVARHRPVTWDDSISGFGARLNGPRKVSFIIKYRVRSDPRQRLVTLGDYPSLSPDQARLAAGEIRSAAAQGRDVFAERKAAADAAIRAREAERAARVVSRLTLGRLLDDWRAQTEDQIQEKLGHGESVAYERELLRLEAKVLRPKLGSTPVGSLDPEIFQSMLFLERSVAKARSLRSLIVRVVKFSNAVMSMRGIKRRWPTKFEVEGRIRSRSNRFSVNEMARLWIAAGALGRRGALLRFMMLTGCRRGEAQKAEWSHIHLEDAVLGPYWEQPAHLTKNHRPHRVPLSPPALAMLQWLPVRVSKDAGKAKLIFAGRGNVPVGGWTDLRRTMLDRASVSDGTLHDFRRTVVSTLGDHGFDPQVADALLNHSAAQTMGGVMAVYQRSELWTRRRDAIALWTKVLFEEVGKVAGDPSIVEHWGFNRPFEEARIVRPTKVTDASRKPGYRP